MSDRIELGPGVRVDLSRLIDTRLLVQATSGAGKSWLLRRLLEQTHGRVQQIVIDPEGEFASLRERFDYVLAARHGGDTAADPRAARLLAERLLELGVSAILDVYELKPPERVRFVRLFCEALVDAPRKLWHPALVVIDEGHTYVPQQGEAESAGAVIDLCARGRKRGYCAVIATQRLSKLHKDAAAELGNKVIGRTGLDVDVKRAADELGFDKEHAQTLRRLNDGEFYVYGPALSRTVRTVRVGPVQTTHPKAGARLAFVVPPPTAKIVALLPKLADLPAESERRERTTQELRRELVEVKRQLAATGSETRVAPAVRVEVPVVSSVHFKRAEVLIGRVERAVESLGAVGVAFGSEGSRLSAALAMVRSTPAPSATSGVRREEGLHRAPGASVALRPSGNVQQRILDALAELEALGSNDPARELVALLAGYSNLKSTGFVKAMSALRTAGLVDYPSVDAMILTDEGRRHARQPSRPRTSREIQERVIAVVGGAAGRILTPLIEAYPGSMKREEVAERAGYGNLKSTGFVKAMSRLRTLGFVDYPDASTMGATPVLFLDGVR